MKTTIDLPEDLVREMKLRAVHEGRRLKEVAADLIRDSLSPRQDSGRGVASAVAKSLPLIKSRPAPPGETSKMTAQEMCEWIKEADLQLEIERYEENPGHQHVDRADA